MIIAANIFFRLRKATALLLLAVFLFITGLQVLHSHAGAIAHADTPQEAIYALEKCSVCDYVVHQQSKYSLLYDSAVVPTFFSPATAFVSKRYVTVAYFQLQGFSNKAPPAFLA